MNTWVLCFSRRKALLWTIRSRSRCSGERRPQSSSGTRRRAGHERAASEDCSEIQLSKPVFGALDALRDFMFDQVYLREDTHHEHERATRLIRELFQYFLDHPGEMPEEYHRAPGDAPTRVADYISGMTDRYAIRTYERLFLPHGWLHDQG